MSSDPSCALAKGYLLAYGRTPADEELSGMVHYARKHGLANACRLMFNANEFVFVD